METSRLKSIAIIILALLNGFLLLLLGYQHFQAQQAVTDAAEQLRALYEANQLTLGEDIDLSLEAMTPLTLNRDTGAERAIAMVLLGEETVSSSQGGGIVSYTSEIGTVQFRAMGSFDGSRLARRTEDPLVFAEDFCQRFGYEEIEVVSRDQMLAVTSVQCLEGVPIVGCELTMRFEGDVLTSVTGAHVSLESVIPEAGELMNCVTALVRFLDYREEAGVVCSEVTDVQCVYELQGGAVSLRLTPMWRIETDTYTYFVDCSGGAVSRR